MPIVPERPKPNKRIPILNPRTKLVLDLLDESRLPHPFKCSRCDYIAKTDKQLKLHWAAEH